MSLIELKDIHKSFYGVEVLHGVNFGAGHARVEAVKPYFERFLAELPDLEALAAVPEKKRRGAELQAGVGRFFWHTLRTMTGIKKWWLLNKRLELESDFGRANALLDEMEMLIREEAENVRETLPLVDADSRLGWEPSMDYMADREHLEWKLRQLDNLLNKTLPAYRRTIALCPSIK